MKFAILASIIFMVFGAITCSYISNRYSYENTANFARVFSVLSIICISVTAGVMFWKYLDFFTIPRLLLLISVCSYIKHKKRNKFCTPFWKKFYVTCIAYIVLGGTGFAMYIVDKSTNGNYTNDHIAVLFTMMIPIMIALIIITNIIFGRLLIRRRVASYYY